MDSDSHRAEGDAQPPLLRSFWIAGHRGREVKRGLVAAALAACDAVRNIEPRARFLYTEPPSRPADGVEGVHPVADRVSWRAATLACKPLVGRRATPGARSAAPRCA